MTKLQRLIQLVEGLDSSGGDYATVREAQMLAKELEAGK